jgi:hypothetical protein
LLKQTTFLFTLFAKANNFPVYFVCQGKQLSCLLCLPRQTKIRRALTPFAKPVRSSF